MRKRFNDTGVCVASKHFMVDIPHKIKQIMEMIAYGEYFVINRPRQFGKTTTISMLEKKLKDDYIVISISFGMLGDSSFQDEAHFCPEFVAFLSENITEKLTESACDIKTLSQLSVLISKIAKNEKKPLVLIIDEVDKSSNNQLFINFLGILREKFLNAQRDKDTTFHAVILAGVHDVKTLKLKLRPDEEAKYNSPWNIASDFEIDMTFDPQEIETMLIQYSQETKNNLDIEVIAKEIYFYTSGYPYFVSKLCKIIDEEIYHKKNNIEWQKEDVVSAVKILLDKSHNTNFDNLIKNLENDEKLASFIKRILMNSEVYKFAVQVPLINKAFIHGIINKDELKNVKIFNRIFEEYLTEYFVGKFKIENPNFNPVQYIYVKEDGRLDIKKILLKFQEVIQEKYSNSELLKSDEFLENDLRMLFLVFLKPILNGVGFSYKEAQISAEKRLDVVVFFKDERFIIELKLWYGARYHQQGIAQLKDYMMREHLKNAYMIIMSKRKEKKFQQSDEDGIFTIWM